MFRNYINLHGKNQRWRTFIEAHTIISNTCVNFEEAPRVILG